MTSTNNLKKVINCKDVEGNDLIIEITLNDECKNGHQDFAITATGYQKDKPHIDRYFLYSGCCHDEILKVRPDLKIFVDLHLCDYTGCPMHPTANGFYHLTNGFNKTKIDDANFIKEYCEYYRITVNQYKVLSTSKNQTQYAVNLYKLGILEQWQEQANKAIRLLEDMTGEKFVIDSKKTQFIAPTEKELQEEETRQKTGYYTDKAEKERQKQYKISLVKELKEELNKKIQSASDEYKAKLAVLKAGGKKALDNCIYYNHSKTIAFNWRSYDNLSNETIEKIKSKIKLPVGVKIEIK